MANRLMRTRLNERLARAAQFPVTLIVAPAGFGKTVALRDFLEINRLDVIRYDVRREQNSLLAFVRGLAVALKPIAPSAQAAFPLLGTRAMAADEPARECSDWMAEHLKRTVCTIVIDDLHHAAVDLTSVAFLVDVIERTKERIAWILATRSDAGLPVASWVGYGTMDAPVGEDQLRFTNEEALAAADDVGTTSDAREVEALRELTGGWPVALAIALRTRTQAADLRTASAGTREMIYRYLAEQVFARLSLEQRRFLIDTCVFAAFDAGIAEALGATPELFSQVRRDVAFLSATSTNEYRYHDLFRDFLESELRRSSEREWKRVIVTAAGALQGRGRNAEALRLLTKIAADSQILEIIERSGFDLIERGEAETVASALDVVPETLRLRSAVALGVAATLDAARGHFDVAEGRFSSAIAAADDPSAKWALIYRYALELVRNERDCIDILAPLVAGEAVSPELRASVLATLATAYAGQRRLFGVPRPSMIRRLQAAERIGLVERVCKGFVKWNRLNRDHPAYSQIKRLAKSLGRIFPIPAGVVHRMSFSAMGSKPRLYAAVDVFGAGQHAARAESLLFLGALDESVPISRLSGVFGRDRFPTTGAIDALEAFGMVRSIRQRKQRLVSLDRDWVAYEDLSRLIRRLNRIDPTYADLAAAYLAVDGNVASIR